MPRGGYRPGAGRPKGSKNKVKKGKTRTKKVKPDLPDNIKDEAAAEGLTPLEYMLQVMNNSGADEKRRDQMAFWLLPYCHPKADVKGKKASKEDRAKKAGSGKFAPAAAPRLAAVGGKAVK